MPMTGNLDALSSNLTFNTLLSSVQSTIDQIQDPRKPSNATTHTFSDIVMSGFAVFFMQCSSFLEYQRQVQQQQGKDNAQGLFGIAKIPSDNQIRNVLDQVCASLFFPIFLSIYVWLEQRGYLEPCQVLDGNLLVAIDGIEYFHSKRINCDCCSHRMVRFV